MNEVPNSIPGMIQLAKDAFIAASFDVIDLARRTNTPIVQWKDGRIIYSTPDEVEATLPPRPKLKTEN